MTLNLILMERKFKVSILVSVDTETIKEGMQQAKETIQRLGLKPDDVKPIHDQRTLAQNNALHLLFTQLAEELNEKGLDMRQLIREEVDISWTPYSVKEYLWRPLQKIITGKRSTTKLSKTQEIDTIYKNLNRILIERTKGEVCLPPFPSIDSLIQ
jgi:hypothetical protein